MPTKRIDTAHGRAAEAEASVKISVVLAFPIQPYQDKCRNLKLAILTPTISETINSSDGKHG